MGSLSITLADIVSVCAEVFSVIVMVGHNNKTENFQSNFENNRQLTSQSTPFNFRHYIHQHGEIFLIVGWCGYSRCHHSIYISIVMVPGLNIL